MSERTLSMRQKIKRNNSNYAKALKVVRMGGREGRRTKREEAREGEGRKNRAQDTKDTYKENFLRENIIEEYT